MGGGQYTLRVEWWIYEIENRVRHREKETGKESKHLFETVTKNDEWFILPVRNDIVVL